MMKTLAIVLAVGTGALAGSAPLPSLRASLQSPAAEPAWTEVRWPFALDQWGVGRAFVCSPAACGVRVELTIRPKIGFCNCATGVSDDSELERVGDTEVLGAKTEAKDSGRPVKIGWMQGLSRRYRVLDGPGRANALSLAVNDECDVVVALATGDGDPAAIEPAVMTFLNSKPMVLWAKKELGLEFVHRDF